MNSHANFSQPFVQSSPPSPCKSEGRFTGWKAQFACPQGKLGWLVGQFMAFKNAPMNRFAVETLKVQSEDQILEIGFAHGHATQIIASQASKGFVAGIDISEVMVRQATKRNQEFIESGRMELGKASVASIPYEFGRFDKALAVNNYHFWPNAEHNLTEIRRVLSENGLLVLCLRMKAVNSAFELAPGFTEQEVEEVTGLLRWVGFRDVQLAKRNLGRRDAICVMARK
ncbi:MAG: class I SAM-dependent methyltransferase [Blastocatellia bacterium]